MFAKTSRICGRFFLCNFVIMKKIVSLIFVFCISLGMIAAQQLNQRVFDEKSQTEILVGNITRDGLMGCAFAGSYNEEYPAYTPDADTMKLLKDKL